MRVLLICIATVFCGCASNEFSGTQQKNLEVTRMERLGTLTYSDIPSAGACGSRQVRWCRDDGGSKQCRCVYVHEARERLRRMVGGSSAH